ncbi:MAG: hypothetical protein J7L23_03250 [Candidatus Diapherotrites archaeon]|nr:hypothetical protein [Candidatus Diapherotrites archaeon]
MLNERGQAFDAFKLLIAAVVAGAILVIILGMLQGFIIPVGQPMSVMTQGISTTSKAAGSGTVSPQAVKFVKGDILSTDGVADQAGVNKNRVCFCNSTTIDGAKACPAGYVFDNGTYFTVLGKCGGTTGMSIEALEDINGKIRVYNKEGTFYIGFKPS